MKTEVNIGLGGVAAIISLIPITFVYLCGLPFLLFFSVIEGSLKSPAFVALSLAPGFALHAAWKLLIADSAESWSILQWLSIITGIIYSLTITIAFAPLFFSSPTGFQAAFIFGAPALVAFGLIAAHIRARWSVAKPAAPMFCKGDMV